MYSKSIEFLTDDFLLSAAHKAQVLEALVLEMVPLKTKRGQRLLRRQLVNHVSSMGRLAWFYFSTKSGIRDLRTFIGKSYNDIWSGGTEQVSRLISPKSRLWIRGQRAMFHANGFSNQRLFLDYFVEVIRRTNSRKVIELGSGCGLNLTYLAKALPDVEFVGLELTPGGVASANDLLKKPLHPDLLKWLNGGTPDRFDNHPPQNLKFIQGDATKTSFDDRSFDLALTYLALEQMLPHQNAALKEISRITRHSCVHIEPYWEVNAWRQRADRVLRSNFVEKKSIHAKFGWEEVQFMPLSPHKVSFQSALYWGRKTQPL